MTLSFDSAIALSENASKKIIKDVLKNFDEKY